MSTFRVICFVIIVTLLGCQQRGEPVPTLTQAQWRHVQQNLLEESPTTEHPIGAVFGEHFRLIGWDLEPAAFSTGEEFTLSFYWEVLKESDKSWKIFVHLENQARQNIDHDAIGDTYPTRHWSVGEIIQDEVKTTLDSDIAEGDIRILVGFFQGEERLAITDPGEATVTDDGRLLIGSAPMNWETQSYNARLRQNDIVIDGQINDRAWARAPQTESWGSPINGDENSNNTSTWSKILWDNEAIYFALYARDRDIWATFDQRDQHLWNEEVFEIFLDPRNNGQNYIELQINPLGTVFDAQFVQANNRDLETAVRHTISGLETAVHVNGTIDNRSDRDRSWSAEVRIPFSSLEGLENIPPENGDTMRVNFYRYDRSGQEVTTVSWTPVGQGTFHNPARFGEITFRGTPQERTQPVPVQNVPTNEQNEQFVAPFHLPTMNQQPRRTQTEQN